MAGSQLKALKASLKSAGLTGQTNVKKKGKKSKTPSESRRDDKQQIIQKIREEFNPFELKMNRVKRDITEVRKTRQVVGKPGISKQIGEEQRKESYEERKKLKNKVGGVVDRRFGENNPHLNPEEKMLERFTRERQISSKKNSLFNLDDDESDDGDLELTHYGHTLSLKDDFDEGDLKHDLSDIDEDEQQPERKKTKAEVMKEVIAKSKFYKHQRQKEQQINENDIHELDEEFDDIMQELQSIKPSKKAVIEPKSETDLAYDARIKELAFDRRSVPADRTKTVEELETERNEKMKKLEADRLKRMQGLDTEETKHAVADDLDDDFWANASGDEAEGFTIKEDEEKADSDDENSGSDSDSDSNSESETIKKDGPTENIIKIGNKVIKTTAPKVEHISCPETEEQFLQLLSQYQFKETNQVVNKILDIYQPKLAAGNKEKLANFSGVLLNHILYLSDNQSMFNKDEFVNVVEKLIYQLRRMTEKYNETLYETFKSKITEIQQDINDSNQYEPKISDLIFYSIVGSFYSTSDLYHLIVTPTLILICETLEILRIQDNFENLAKGVFLVELLLKYQRLSKRFIPEMVAFVEKAFLCLIPEVGKIDVNKLLTLSSKHFKSSFNLNAREKLVGTTSNIEISQLNDIKPTLELKSKLVFKLINVVDNFNQLYKSEPAFVEIVSPFIVILKHLIKYQADIQQLSEVLSKSVKLVSNATHKPLKLQDHKPMAIASNVPKYEENFNPMKKSYDFDPQRQEINKLKAQLKNERKLALKDIRKDSRFEAREKIKEKKQMYKDYHNKMSSIVNSISTVEGAEKNEYEREKKQRKNKH